MSKLVFEAHCPLAGSSIALSATWPGLLLRVTLFPTVTAALAGCRTFRAEVLHDDGGRPEFRDEHGYTDEQQLDLGSYHVEVREHPDGPLLAYARLSPPALTGGFQARLLLGDDRFDAVLASIGVPSGRVAEVGRLVVPRALRGRQLGVFTAASVMAVVRAFGWEGLIAHSGVRDGQYQLYQRLGLHVHPGIRLYSARYQDELCIVTHRTDHETGEYESLTHTLHQQLVRTFHPVGRDPLSSVGTGRVRARPEWRLRPGATATGR